LVGPRLVRTEASSQTGNDAITFSTTSKKTIGASSGSVTPKQARSGPAPSTRAAPLISVGMLCNPAG